MVQHDGKQQAEDFIRRHNLELIRVAFTDLHGIPRGKLVPTTEYIRRVESGFRFCQTIFAKDINGYAVEDALSLLDARAPDLVALPDPATYAPLPSCPGTGQVFLDLFESDGVLFPYAPRSVLRRVIQRAGSADVTPRVASELEFYLLAKPRLVPSSLARQPYDVTNLPGSGTFLTEALHSLKSAGLSIEGMLREAGPGQLEINLVHEDALTTADSTVLFKTLIKEVAARHGLVATFMAKPFSKHAGNGFHVNQSLWNRTGSSNMFAAPTDRALAPMTSRFLSGLLEHLPGATAFFAPSPNSYKRLRPQAFVPIAPSWGWDDRTVALRIPQSTGMAARVENRVPGADANPYLVIAASLASGLCGLCGMHASAPLPPPSSPLPGTPLTPLPRSPIDALQALCADDCLMDALGSDFVRLFAAVKRAECLRYEERITVWERRAYLHTA